MRLTDEPNMDTIDDYNNNETPEKKRTIRLIILGLVVFAIIGGFLKYQFSTVSDYIGTANEPGIELNRK